MYTGGFYPYATPEEYWAYWSRYIWINRYMDAPKPTYKTLLALVKDKDYFVITTNVDHCFQKAGFDPKRLFYTQGDYGLFQCSAPCCQETFDNERIVRQMLAAQNYVIGTDHSLTIPAGVMPKRTIPTELVPHCPHCGRPATMNLRCDDTFAEDEGWHDAAARYENFLRTRAGGKIVFLELGVGVQYSGDYQISVLANDGEKTECRICLHQPGTGRMPKSAGAPCVVHRCGYGTRTERVDARMIFAPSARKVLR